MRINVNYEIADSARTAAKDYSGFYAGRSYNDLPYTNENLQKVFLELKSGKHPSEYAYMESGTPDENEIKNIVQDIVDYYNRNFAYSQSENVYDVKLRFYFHVGSRDSKGDIVDNTIRIFCKQLVFSAEAKRIIKNISLYPAEEFFTNALRILLAHELFHFFHDVEYKEKHKCTIPTVTTTKSNENLINGILMESFAEYFAMCYMRDYLPADDNVRYNNITNGDVELGRLFGIGRKALLGNCYSTEEIQQDSELFEKLKEAKRFDADVSLYGIIGADYGGGYVLKSKGNSKNIQGKALKEYSEVFEDMLNNNKEEALKKMLKYKDELNLRPLL